MTRFLIRAAVFAALICPSVGATQPRLTPSDGPFVAAYEAVQEAREAYWENDLDRAVMLAQPLAKAGNPVAQNLLGSIFTTLDYAGYDYEAGFAWYNRAIAQDFDKAMYNLGDLFLEDHPGHVADQSAAAAAFGRAVGVGYQPAYADLIYLRYFGDDSVVDVAAGDALARDALAADPEDMVVLYLLGDAEYYGIRGQADYAAAYGYFLQAADLGYPDAQADVGYMLTYGEGFAMDDTAADRYFAMAAAQGHPEAHGYLARSYLYGYGGDANPQEAFAIATSGAQLNDGLSHAVLGEIYETGAVGDVNFDKARTGYEQAYGAGYVNALVLLGDLAFTGSGEPVDYEKYYDLATRGLAEGDAYNGHYEVGYAQLYGFGTPQDIPAALRNHEAAWALGNVNALPDLVTIFGHPAYRSDLSDPIIAYAYCSLAREELDIDSNPAFYETSVPTCLDLDQRLTSNQKSDASVLAEGL